MTYEVKFDLAPPTEEQLWALAADLDDEQRRVLLDHGTEAQFCGIFLDEEREGVFTSRLCGPPLFSAGTKFESGTGWPSSDGPPPTGDRYCINSVSLEFSAKGEPHPDKLDRGAPEGQAWTG